MDPAADRTGDELTASQVRELVDKGVATPLLPDVFPVPVHVGARWWAVQNLSGDPPASVQDDLAVYRPVPPPLAAHLDRHRARLAAARAAAPDAGCPPP